MANKDSDRRRHPRISRNDPCWCESDDLTLYVRFGNAAEGGAFLRTATALDVGRTARLVWYSPELDDDVVAQVEVVWRSEERPGEGAPRGMGLRFIAFEKNGDRFLDLLRNTPPEGTEFS